MVRSRALLGWIVQTRSVARIYSNELYYSPCYFPSTPPSTARDVLHAGHNLRFVCRPISTRW
jgi:hypothetical protein